MDAYSLLGTALDTINISVNQKKKFDTLYLKLLEYLVKMFLSPAVPN